jgi:hypothetical protein
MNGKVHKINEARRKFALDLQSDKDFIEYKKRSEDYGTIHAVYKSFELNEIGESCETIISQYLQTIKKRWSR